MYERDHDGTSTPARLHPYQRPQQSGARKSPLQQDAAPVDKRQQATAPTARPRRNETLVARPPPHGASVPRTQNPAAQRHRYVDEEALFDEPMIGGHNIPRNRSTPGDLHQQGLLHTERAPCDGRSMTFSHATEFGLASQPSDASSYDEPDTPSKGRGLDAEVPKNSIGIGIETEFFLRAKAEPRDQDPRRRRQDAAAFCREVKDLHNVQVASNFPRMESIFERDCVRWPDDRHDTWILMRDSTMCTNKPPWGIEMTTPLFRAYKGSPWREEIKETWKFLKRNYVVSTNAVPEDRVFEKTGCATHVHISIRRGFQLADMQKIAQFVIHFEPAIEALLPEERRGQLFARSNWLDNKNFVTGKKTRRQAIDEIGLTRDRQAVVNLMSPRPAGNHFAWAFSKLEKHKTIEFRKPGPSKSAEETIMWAEFAMAFILSAMQIENTIKYMREVPPNVGGLKQFLLLRKKEPYMCDPTYLAPLWRGKTGKEIQQPKPTVESHWTKLLPGLQRMVEVEETEYLRLYKVEEALQIAVRKRDVDFHRSSSI